MSLPLKPSGYRILVKQKKLERKSCGGIILATNDQQAREQKGNTIGEVVAVGPIAWDEERLGGGKFPWAKVGDMVMFPRYAGFQFDNEDDAVHWHVMNDEDILGTIPQEKENG